MDNVMIEHPRLLGKAMLNVTIMVMFGALLLSTVILGFYFIGIWLIPVMLAVALLSFWVASEYKDLVRLERYK